MEKRCFGGQVEPGRYLQINFSKDSAGFQAVARSAEYDALLSKVIAEPDFDKRIILNRRLMKQMIDGDCMINLVSNNGYIYLKSPNLNDDHRGDIWFRQWFPQDAWFSQK
jgi:ABC-type oligopeptide transport system substrate-binding subunit